MRHITFLLRTGEFILVKDIEQEQTRNKTENEEKERITRKEFLDGCGGCSSLGCLPFAIVFIAFIVKAF